MVSKVMENYLLENHKEDITDLLNDDNDKTHISINIDLVVLKDKNHTLFKAVIRKVQLVSSDWDKALLQAQKKIVEDGNAFLEPEFQIKEDCHVRFVNLPTIDNPLKNQNLPSIDDVGLFVQVKGTITRVNQKRLLEFKREYVCSKCKETFLIEAEYGRMYIFDVPKYCINSNGICYGTLQRKNSMPLSNFFMDYQEIRLQEISKKRYRVSLLICLENDLVDTCVPGECVTMCGTIEYQRGPIFENKCGNINLTMHAVGIIKDEKKVNINKDFAEKMICIRGQWEDDCNNIGQLNARDLIIQSICPEIYGMYPVKLALALALCSGMEDEQSNGIIGSITKRGNSHILLIGDPGLAKSILLKFISKISLRSVHTTGLGCSAAGLTAAAIRDDGEWHLEAGALVLADGGVCCIDEFNLMQEHDKGALHEAMEQQTVSIAKAGIVSILHTRCVILAATNARCLYSVSDPEGLSALNIGIGTPLLSRFDLIFILRDERNSDWDNRVAMHLLGNIIDPTTSINNGKDNNKIWNLERLQSHFLAAHEIKPILTTEANIILRVYYKMCRSDLSGDPSRTTVRLLDSLIRLAQSHARLMLRSEVLAIDAVIVIRLMESTWGFGRLLTPLDVVKEELPLGPNSDDIRRILNVLNLINLEEKLLDQLKSLEEYHLTNDSILKNRTQNLIIENEVEKKRKCTSNKINIDDIERIFGFENHVKKVKISNKGNKNNVNQENYNKSEDTICLNLDNNSDNLCNSKLKNANIQSNSLLNKNVSQPINDLFDCGDDNDSGNLCNLQKILPPHTNSDTNIQPHSLLNKNLSPPINDLIDWGDDNDFELSLDLLQKSDNSQSLIESVHNEKLRNIVIKETENVPIVKFNSIYNDPNLDDIDLELDNFLNNNEFPLPVQVTSKKDIKKDFKKIKPIKTKETINIFEKENDKPKPSILSNSNEITKKSENKNSSVPGSSTNINLNEKRKEISKKTLQKLNNFINPLQIDATNTSDSSKEKEMNNSFEIVNVNSQNNIYLLATQYDNLDFLEFD